MHFQCIPFLYQIVPVIKIPIQLSVSGQIIRVGHYLWAYSKISPIYPIYFLYQMKQVHNSLFFVKHSPIYLKYNFAVAENEITLPTSCPAMQPSAGFLHYCSPFALQPLCFLDLSLMWKSRMFTTWFQRVPTVIQNTPFKRASSLFFPFPSSNLVSSPWQIF